VITGHRNHGHILATGLDAKSVMAELTGRRSGSGRGKGGSMHLFSRDKHFFGGHGIVGASVPLGAGLALANKYRGNNQVCFCYFGDGAIDQGQAYETFNMAAHLKLPIVFAIENNRFATEASMRKPPAASLSQRGLPFAIPGEQVDGVDIRAVHAAGVRVVDRVRAGNGPCILELTTYRYQGHSMSNIAGYRSREEIGKVREQRDPIERSRVRLLAQGYVTEAELSGIDRAIRDQVNAAAEFAETDPEPDARELWTDVVA
jgi:pyruvate dehydrogenase E1 component alpha subunit